ncbi:MAG: hypothetical protein SPH53_04665, partial [Bacteroidaceae bacterium]|nr:hypothetical protein [Bacteroidaceae bacterium]
MAISSYPCPYLGISHFQYEDITQGYTELNTTPHTRRVKTVFFAMRHALDDMEARQECMDIMRELFRQFISILIQE